MNENIDLTKILDGCPIGTEFYCSMLGEVIFMGIDRENPSYPITIKTSFETSFRRLTKQGKYFVTVGECIIFPSKDQRDWTKFERFWDKPKVERFNPKTFQPFDKILTRDGPKEPWRIEFFSCKKDESRLIKGLIGYWDYAIPCNDETKHLVGTTDDCPDYYKWWEK